MFTVKANDIKTKGISFIDKFLKKYEVIFVTVRGKNKYVILPIEEYQRLKEAELEKAIAEAEEDYKEGKYISETAEEHFKRLGI
ncbi:MAG: type II toxin-antitoxin system prevent-host-death family antitoxin [Hydrogenothermaceae bacterium]